MYLVGCGDLVCSVIGEAQAMVYVVMRYAGGAGEQEYGVSKRSEGYICFYLLLYMPRVGESMCMRMWMNVFICAGSGEEWMEERAGDWVEGVGLMVGAGGLAGGGGCIGAMEVSERMRIYRRGETERSGGGYILGKIKFFGGNFLLPGQKTLTKSFRFDLFIK